MLVAKIFSECTCVTEYNIQIYLPRRTDFRDSGRLERRKKALTQNRRKKQAAMMLMTVITSSSRQTGVNPFKCNNVPGRMHSELAAGIGQRDALEAQRVVMHALTMPDTVVGCLPLGNVARDP